MFVLIIVNLLAVFLAYQSTYTKNRYLFEWAFVLLVLVYGIRYNYGNDYLEYEHLYDYITSFNSIGLALGDGHFEDGWIILNFLFKPLGFKWLVVFLTVTQFLPIYLLIKKYVNPKLWYLALFVFLFSTDTLINLSMMRQALAANIILLTIPLYEKKRGWLLGIIAILFAAQFHRTAYVMLIIPLIGLASRLSRKALFLSYIGLLMVAFLLSTSVNSVVELMLGTDLLEQYESINTKGERYMTFGIGYIINLLMCMIILTQTPNSNQTVKLLSILYCISYVFTTMSYSNANISRFSLYFTSLMGILIGFLYNKMKVSIPYFGILLLVLAIRIYAYWGFFFSPVWTRHYLHFTTIFSN